MLEVKDVSLNVKVMALILNESKGKKNVKMNVNEWIHVYSLWWVQVSENMLWNSSIANLLRACKTSSELWKFIKKEKW